MERDLERQIRDKFGWLADREREGRVTKFSQRRLELNLLETKALIREAYRKMGRDLRGDLKDLAGLESRFVPAAIEKTLEKWAVEGVGIGIASGALLTAIVDRRPFQGRLLREWAAKLDADTYGRVAAALRTGMAGNETIDQIVRRIRGTAKNKYRDGVLQGSRRDITAVVRTAHAHVANAARMASYAEAKDFIGQLRWESVLDDRTTPQCQIRDGLMYTFDGKPIGHEIPSLGFPPIHWNCRSMVVAQFKTWHKLPVEMDKEQRAAFNGPVSADTTYAQWLARQDQATQERVLGKTRARLFRAGKIKFADLYDDRGILLSVAEIEELERAA